MRYDNKDLPTAYNHVYNIRRDIHVNPAFIQQLHVWNAIKFDYPQRREYPEYRHWEISRNANIVTGNPFLEA
jgi:protein-tyrosine phosphatase